MVKECSDGGLQDPFLSPSEPLEAVLVAVCAVHQIVATRCGLWGVPSLPRTENLSRTSDTAVVREAWQFENGNMNAPMLMTE